MWYYSKKNDCFYHDINAMLELNEEIRALNADVKDDVQLTDDIITYSDEQYALLFDCDVFHYVAQDATTGLPVKKEISAESKANYLRKQREKECFPIINRGALWYNKLTETQKQELSAWYEEWLDAPETGVIPTAPAWLDTVSSQKS